MRSLMIGLIIRQEKEPYLDWTSSLPLNLFITEDMPALTPVITAKLRACTKGPPARAYNLERKP